MGALRGEGRSYAKSDRFRRRLRNASTTPAIAAAGSPAASPRGAASHAQPAGRSAPKVSPGAADAPPSRAPPAPGAESPPPPADAAEDAPRPHSPRSHVSPPGQATPAQASRQMPASQYV